MKTFDDLFEELSRKVAAGDPDSGTVRAVEAEPDLSDLDAALTPNSLVELEALIEPAMAESTLTRFQFERQGYFCRDEADAGLYHRTVTLRDSYKPGS